MHAEKNCVVLTKVVDGAKVHSVAGSHFMAAVLKQIYLDDVSGFEPASFSSGLAGPRSKMLKFPSYTRVYLRAHTVCRPQERPLLKHALRVENKDV